MRLKFSISVVILSRLQASILPGWLIMMDKERVHLHLRISVLSPLFLTVCLHQRRSAISMAWEIHYQLTSCFHVRSIRTSDAPVSTRLPHCALRVVPFCRACSVKTASMRQDNFNPSTLPYLNSLVVDDIGTSETSSTLEYFIQVTSRESVTRAWSCR